MKKEKVTLGWAGGVSSAVALYELKCPDFKIQNLSISIEQDTGKPLGRHLSFDLIRQQVTSLDLKLNEIKAPAQALPFQSDEEVTAIEELQSKKIQRFAVGSNKSGSDQHAVKQLLQAKAVKALFPLWDWPPQEVARVFFMLGFEAIVYSVDTRKCPASFLGRKYDKSFISSLPTGVNILGDQGEFKTFVHHGPFFQFPVQFAKGEKQQMGDELILKLDLAV